MKEVSYQMSTFQERQQNQIHGVAEHASFFFVFLENKNILALSCKNTGSFICGTNYYAIAATKKKKN